MVVVAAVLICGYQWLVVVIIVNNEDEQGLNDALEWFIRVNNRG